MTSRVNQTGKLHRRQICVCAAAVLLAAVSTEAAVGASAVVRYEKDLILSEGASGVPQPVSVSVDGASGEICVTDAKGPALHVFNPRGIEVFHTNALSGLSAPKSSSIDARGAIVFTDSPSEGGSPTIRRLNAFGEPETFDLEAPALNWSPRYLTITRDGNYLTLDVGGALLAKHDSQNGKLLWQHSFGYEGARELHLGAPFEAADGRIYLPGGELHQVLVLSAQGRQLERFGRFGTAQGKLVFPVGVASGPAGTILVLDRLRHKVLVYDENRSFLTEFGGQGFGPGQFYHPLAIASGPEGRFYVAQRARGRVQMYRIAIGNDGS